MSPVREHTAIVSHAKALDLSQRWRRFSLSLKSDTGSIPPSGASFIIWSSFSDSAIPRTIQAASDFVVAIDRIKTPANCAWPQIPSRLSGAHHADSQGTVPNSGQQLSKVSPNLPCPGTCRSAIETVFPEPM